MIAQGTVSLTAEEVKQALIEFVERQGFTRLYPKAMEENVKIEYKAKRIGSTGGMTDGYEVVTHTATVLVEAKKK